MRYGLIDGLLMVHQRIHAAKQLLVAQRASGDARQADRLKPAQHAQLGVRITQAVEHHRAQRMLDRRGVAGTAKHTGQRVKAQFMPKLMQRPHIPQRQGWLEGHLRHGHIARPVATGA